MIKCSQCGHENVPGTQFCEGCGEELPAASASTGGAAAPGSSDAAMIQCPACDNMNPADNVACEVCGAELPHRTSADASAGAVPTSVSPSMPTGFVSGPAAVATPDAGVSTSAAALPDVDVSMPSAPLTIPVPGGEPLAPSADDSAPVPPTPVASTIAGTPAGGLQPGQVKLVVEQGQTVGAQFVLGDAEMLVGREDTEEEIYPDIDLADQDAGYVHRRHATLRFENGALSVTHLGGGNKTRVNNRPIPDNEPQPVKLGDKVAFGKVVLRVLPA